MTDYLELFLINFWMDVIECIVVFKTVIFISRFPVCFLAFHEFFVHIFFGSVIYMTEEERVAKCQVCLSCCKVTTPGSSGLWLSESRELRYSHREGVARLFHKPVLTTALPATQWGAVCPPPSLSC